MKRGHAEILGTHQPEHQRITNLVQSTDQRLHRLETVISQCEDAISAVMDDALAHARSWKPTTSWTQAAAPYPTTGLACPSCAIGSRGPARPRTSCMNELCRRRERSHSRSRPESAWWPGQRSAWQQKPQLIKRNWRSTRPGRGTTRRWAAVGQTATAGPDGPQDRPRATAESPGETGPARPGIAVQRLRLPPRPAHPHRWPWPAQRLVLDRKWGAVAGLCPDRKWVGADDRGRRGGYAVTQ